MTWKPFTKLQSKYLKTLKVSNFDKLRNSSSFFFGGGRGVGPLPSPQIWSDFAKIFAGDGILADKNSVLETCQRCLLGQDLPKVSSYGSTLTPLLP